MHLELNYSRLSQWEEETSSSRAPELVHMEMSEDAQGHPDHLSGDPQAQGEGASAFISCSVVLRSGLRMTQPLEICRELLQPRSSRE